MKSTHFIFARRRGGFALIIVLAVMAIIALTTIAFLSKSQVGVASSANFSNAASAAALGQDALNTVVASLQLEIVDSANSAAPNGSFSSNPIYVPLLAKNLLPQLDASSVTDTTAVSNQPLLSLIKTSQTAPGSATDSVTGFQQNQNYLSFLASNVATDTPSRNGRYVPLARWNDPKLLTTAQNNGQPACPRWVYVNRKGPVGLNAYDPLLAKSFSAGAINYQFVTGRYAYRVYDTSGLLDLNVAGSTSSAVSENGRKGSLAWLNFQDPSVSVLGINSGNTSLFDWRGPGANYANYADDFGPQYGFLLAPPATGYADAVTSTAPSFPNANRFLNRNDLIQFAYDSANSAQFVAGTAGATTVPAPEPFISQATMFSREVNAPSWGPDPAAAGTTTFMASPTYLNPVSSATAASATPTPSSIADTRVTTSFVRRAGTTAAIGEPLVKSRFPLSKIDLLNNPTTANAGAILQYFGLTYQGDGTWKYGHPGDGPNLTVLDSTLAAKQTVLATGERLHTLLEVAGGGTYPVQAPREPDFFEMLQAGIQPDSLGQGVADVNSTYTAYLTTEWRDQNIARHVLQIGANIIDQWGAGNDPTVIRRTPLTSFGTAGAQPDPDIVGIKNLPYIQLIGRTYFRRFDITETGPSGAINYPHVTSYFQFQLWNPHQNAASSVDGNFRIVAEGTVQIHLTNIDNSGGGVAKDVLGQAITYTSTGANPDSIAFTLASDPKGKKFTEPSLLLSASTGISTYNSTNRDTNTTNFYTHNKAQIAGFWQGDLIADYDGFANHSAAVATLTAKSYYERFGTERNSSSAPVTGTPAALHYPTGYPTTIFTAVNPTTATNSSVLSFQLQKKDALGNWRPVQTIPAIANSRSYSSDGITLLNNVPTVATSATDSALVDNNPACVDAVALLPDPRTIRFGAFVSSTGPVAGTSSVSYALTKAFVFMGWIPSNLGQNASSGVTLNLACQQLYQNSPTSTAFYKDRGATITRQGDVPGTSPYSTGSTARPIMLNRRFHSLAELGYVFRDLPWRSLNFSRDNAASTTASPQPTADAGLLDLFSLTQTPVRAGVVNLNEAPASVLTALLNGTALSPGAVSPDPTALSSTDVASVVAAIQNYVGSRTTPTGKVIGTAADIALALQTDPTVSAWPKLKMEGAIAALADVHNARTWNLLVDVVAQTGRFPNQPSTASLADFVVSGQRHLLFQVAIDRYTGKIVDEILEPSSEVDLSSTSTP